MHEERKKDLQWLRGKRERARARGEKKSSAKWVIKNPGLSLLISRGFPGLKKSLNYLCTPRKAFGVSHIHNRTNHMAGAAQTSLAIKFMVGVITHSES